MKKLHQLILLGVLGYTTLSFAEEPRIPYITPQNATGEVQQVYNDVNHTFGMIPTPIMQHSVSPELLKNHWELFQITGKNKHFSQKFLAIMRMTIATSGIFQHCDYCVDGNAMMLKHMFKMNDKEIIEIQHNPSSAPLNQKEKTMLKFLLTATNTPKSLTNNDFDILRKLGWNDKDIFEGLKMATQMVAAIYMVNALNLPSHFGGKE